MHGCHNTVVLAFHLNTRKIIGYYCKTNRILLQILIRIDIGIWIKDLECRRCRKVIHSRKDHLNTVSKWCNAISMGLSKQKSSPLDSYKK